jgi:D-alanyl-lipoteichoic acid acyltransferase DltB (MBOAT superfamily)
VSKLFGFNLMQNFSFPYFSRDIAEFWRRWHISLTTWFRDYVYIPLGGSRKGILISIRNTFIIFLLSGFWHGAKWTFVLWGLINALYFLPLLLMGKNRKYMGAVSNGNILPSIKEAFSILTTFSLIVFSWIFFRSENVSNSFHYVLGIFRGPFFSLETLPVGKSMILRMIVIILFFVIEWLGRDNAYAIENMPFNKNFRWICYYGILGCIILFSGIPQEFIYFQF